MRTLLLVALAAATVSVRVEGESATLFEGPVTTAARALDGGDGTGAHPCGGPDATVGTALAATGLAWRGTWNHDFGDFFVDRIGADASRPPTGYWAVLVNRRYALGACREAVRTGDEVLWAYDTTTRPVILALAGPPAARAGEPVVVTVRDATTRAGVSGARVGGATTDAAGRAVLRFAAPGAQTLKAEREGAVRSNALHVRVEPGTGPVPAPPPAPGAAPRTRIVEVAGGRDRRRVRGVVVPTPAAGSRLRLVLQDRRPRRCSTWTAAGRLRRGSCRGVRTVAARPRWRVALPRGLPRGRYRLTARLGPEPVERGRNRVTFRTRR